LALHFYISFCYIFFLTNTLAHAGQEPIELEPFSVHRFEGAWETLSEGVCTDFNLMLGNGWEGEIKALSSGERCSCEPGRLLWLYCLEPLMVAFPNEKRGLISGEVFYIHDSDETVDIRIKSGGEGVAAAIAKAWEKK
jgi:hypothetical protein